MGIEAFATILTLLMGAELNTLMDNSGKDTFTKADINEMCAEASKNVLLSVNRGKEKAEKEVKEAKEKAKKVQQAMDSLKNIHTGKVQ